MSVYGGPEFAQLTARETFVTPSALAEYGFLIVSLDSRAVPGLGKRTLDAIYLKLGQAEIDDMAEGVKALWSRPYVDKARVGIFGTSYGGYASVMELLRHPDVFAAASASSPPTDWRNYDTIYTERYMWIPQENTAGYDAGSAMTYAKDLKGRLLLYYGTRRQQRPPVELAAVDQGAAGRRQELRRPGRPRPRPQPGESGPDDGVLHRHAQATVTAKSKAHLLRACFGLSCFRGRSELLVPCRQPLLQLQLRDRLAVHFVRAVGEADRARVRPHRGERKVVADARRAVRLDRAVEDAQRHARHDDLDHRQLAARRLVADRVHQVRRLQRQQPRLLDLHARLGDVGADGALLRQRLAERDARLHARGTSARARARRRRSARMQ